MAASLHQQNGRPGHHQHGQGDGEQCGEWRMANGEWRFGVAVPFTFCTLPFAFCLPRPPCQIEQTGRIDHRAGMDGVGHRQRGGRQPQRPFPPQDAQPQPQIEQNPGGGKAVVFHIAEEELDHPKRSQQPKGQPARPVAPVSTQGHRHGQIDPPGQGTQDLIDRPRRLPAKKLVEAQPDLAVQKEIQRGLPRMGQAQSRVGIRKAIGKDIRIPPAGMGHLKNEKRPKQPYRPNPQSPIPVPRSPPPHHQRRQRQRRSHHHRPSRRMGDGPQSPPGRLRVRRARDGRGGGGQGAHKEQQGQKEDGPTVQCQRYHCLGSGRKGSGCSHARYCTPGLTAAPKAGTDPWMYRVMRIEYRGILLPTILDTHYSIHRKQNRPLSNGSTGADK